MFDMPRMKISRSRCHKFLSLSSGQSTSAVDTTVNKMIATDPGVYVSQQFPPTLLIHMNALRQSQRFCDVEILCCGRRIQVR